MYYNGHKIRYVNGYPAIWEDEKHSTVYLHILVMEKFLGRSLNTQEVVHHCDENRANYDINNLWCFETKADHTAYHLGAKAVQKSNGIYYCPDKYSHCQKCGVEISYGAVICQKCYNSNRPTKCPTKEELLSVIMQYKGNFIQIGKFFGVSDNAVRKWCKKFQLPYHSSDY